MAAGMHAFDRVPVESITERAREVRFGHAFQTLIAAVLFGAFWLVAKLFITVWRSLAWMWTAGVFGWRHACGREDTAMASRRDLAAENEALRLEVKRLGG